MIRRLMWMLAIALMIVPAVADNPLDERAEFTLPLENGRFHMRDALKPLAERLGVDDLAPLEHLDWSIDVQSLTGRMRVTALERLTREALSIEIKPDKIELRIDESRLGDLAKARSQTLERWLVDVMKFESQREIGRFGLTFITSEDARAPAAALTPEMRERVVILVHGLDDPGVMWTDLIPALHAAGFTVGRFEYPNDGPVAESADLLAQCLGDLRTAGVERVDIVAHSMGGLVTRDLLTRSTYYAGDGSSASCGDRYPAVDRLIMLGAPNHGSHLARLRSVAELREHLLPAVFSDRSLREMVRADGNGEAGVDLLPHSDFLRRLNARPLPTHTRCTIVAARWINMNGRTMSWMIGGARRLARSSHAPDWLRDGAGSDFASLVEREAGDAIDGLGDGCVSVESAKLDGVDDFVLVRANHLGMILNIGGASERTPPAIPIIMDRLARPAEK